MASRIVDPMGGDNADFVIERARQRQDLDVETPAIDRRLREYPLGRLCAEGFEAALRVPNSPHCQQLDQKIAQPPDGSLMPRLGNRLLRARRVLWTARRDDQITPFVEKCFHLIKMGDVRRIIRIGEKTNLTAGFQHPLSDREPFPAIDRAVNDSHMMNFRRQASQHIAGAIRRTIKNDQDLIASFCRETRNLLLNQRILHFFSFFS